MTLFNPWLLYFLTGIASGYGAYSLFDKEAPLNWWPIILALVAWASLWNAKQVAIENDLKRKGKWPH